MSSLVRRRKLVLARTVCCVLCVEMSISVSAGCITAYIPHVCTVYTVHIYSTVLLPHIACVRNVHDVIMSHFHPPLSPYHYRHLACISPIPSESERARDLFPLQLTKPLRETIRGHATPRHAAFADGFDTSSAKHHDQNSDLDEVFTIKSVGPWETCVYV